MLRQQDPVELRPLQEIRFLVIVRDEGNSLTLPHQNRLHIMQAPHTPSIVVRPYSITRAGLETGGDGPGRRLA